MVIVVYEILKWSQATVWDIISIIGKYVSLFFHAQVDITVELAIYIKMCQCEETERNTMGSNHRP